MKLHNYCIENNEFSVARDLRGLERERLDLEVEHWYAEAKDNIEAGSRRSRRGSCIASRKRQLLCEHVRIWDRRRPLATGVALQQPE